MHSFFNLFAVRSRQKLASQFPSCPERAVRVQLQVSPNEITRIKQRTVGDVTARNRVDSSAAAVAAAAGCTAEPTVAEPTRKIRNVCQGRISLLPHRN